MADELNRDTVSSADNWQARYENQQAGWERGQVHPALMEWCNSLEIKTHTHVVIPGCGRGDETLYLAKREFRVTAIDFAAAPIEHLKNQLTAQREFVNLHQADVFDFVPESEVDVVYEQTCLCAIAPERRAEYERVIHRWLKPGGLLLALFMQTENTSDGPPFHCELDEMRQLFAAGRWQWPEGSPIRFDHPRGDIHELAVVLEKFPV